MFSPIFATRALLRSSMLSEPSSFACSSASSVCGRSVTTRPATALEKARKSCSRATKSVSQLTSTIAAARPSAARSTAMTPSAAIRVAFLSALARPCLRMSSAAASRSPPVSTRAFLHSIMPAPVRSRSCLTVSAEMLMNDDAPHALRAGFYGVRRAEPRPCCGANRAGRSITGLGPAAPGATAARAACRNSGLLARSAGRGQLRHFLDVQIVLFGTDFLGGGCACRRLGGRGPAPRRRLLAADRGGRLRPPARGFAAGITGLVQLHELVRAHGDGRHGLLALEHGIGNAGGIEVNGPHGIIVTGDHVIDAVGGAIGVYDRHHGDTELPRRIDRDLLVTDIDDEERIRQRLHVLDAAQAPFQLLHLPTQLGRLLLAALLERARSGELGDLAQPLDRLADGLEVRQHAPQPALVDEGLAGARGFLLHRLAGGALGADEEHPAAVGDHAPDE